MDVSGAGDCVRDGGNGDLIRDGNDDWSAFSRSETFLSVSLDMLNISVKRSTNCNG